MLNNRDFNIDHNNRDDHFVHNGAALECVYAYMEIIAAFRMLNVIKKSLLSGLNKDFTPC